MNKFCISLLALVLWLPLVGQSPPGFYLVDTQGAIVDTLRDQDTIDLTQVWRDRLNVAYDFPPGATHSAYSLSYSHTSTWALGTGNLGTYQSSGGQNLFKPNAARITYLTDEEMALTGADWDSLFLGRGGELTPGQWTFQASGRSRSLSIVDTTYDTLDVFIYWDKGRSDAFAYYLVDPIRQSRITRIQSGDNLQKYVGNLGATIEYVPVSPFNEFTLFATFDDMRLEIDTMAYLFASPITYRDGPLEYDETTFVLPGYGGSGKYFIKNQWSERDTGLYVYVPQAKGAYVDQYTIVDTIYADTVLYDVQTRDTTVYNITTLDSIQWDVTIQDSIQWNITTLDSIQWDITTLDSIQYDVAFRDTIVYTFVPRDTIVYNITTLDSIQWDITTLDSIQYNFLTVDSVVKRVVYSDSVVYDTLAVDTYTDLVLPVLLEDLDRISQDAVKLRAILRRIKEEGLREKDLYEQLNLNK